MVPTQSAFPVETKRNPTTSSSDTIIVYDCSSDVSD